jgi:hypothetical protein
MEQRCAPCRKGSLAPFLAEARRLADLPYAERQQRLRSEQQALAAETVAAHVR